MSLSLLLPCVAHAQGSSANKLSCERLTFPGDKGDYGSARVVGDGRLYFLSDVGNCPDEDKACQTGAYVLKGETLLTGRASAGCRCALYAGAKGDRADWVKQNRLLPQPIPTTPSLDAWIGQWGYFDGTISLTRQGDALVIKGEAYWPAANPPADRFPAGPNIGDVEGQAAPQGHRVTVVEGSGASTCKVQLILVGHQLLASDNANCGGNNVRFNGVYTKH